MTPDLLIAEKIWMYFHEINEQISSAAKSERASPFEELALPPGP